MTDINILYVLKGAKVVANPKGYTIIKLSAAEMNKLDPELPQPGTPYEESLD